jgi:acetyl-CoA carboxylase carboxyl transferase alpha subunit/acetyl-CoA carboxylase carboxyl transferase beta subunit
MTGTLSPNVTADTGWMVCPNCQGMIYSKRLVRNLQVCPDCGSHHRLTAHQRIAQLFDGGRAELVEYPVRSSDPLQFTDAKPYPLRLDEARAATGLDEGVVVAIGTIEGNLLVAAVMDFRFLGGSLGAAAGELITRATEQALAERLPLLIASASGGARMQEGGIALMQMAKTSQALGRLDEAGILTISLITDPTYGGVAASFATLCDVVIGEPGARLGFAGPRVIEQTIRQKLPEGFQTVEFLLEHGFIDTIRPRCALRATLARLLSVGGRRSTESAVGGPVADVVVRDPGRLGAVDPWQAVQRARRLDRPTTLDYLSRAFDDFEELHGDRLSGDCDAVVGGMAHLGGKGVMVVGHQKGQTVAELAARNYGMPMPAGYRKAARLMRMAAKLGLPVITLVDTPGAYPGLEAEKQGQAVAIAESIRLMAALPVPVLTLVTGEGGSGGALALAVADDVLICSSAVYSVISPEGCAAILWNDPSKAPAAAAALRVDAGQLLRLGVVDGVVPEPDGGNQADHAVAAQRVHAALLASLRDLSGLDAAELVARRRERLRAFGTAAVTRIAVER